VGKSKHLRARERKSSRPCLDTRGGTIDCEHGGKFQKQEASTVCSWTNGYIVREIASDRIGETATGRAVAEIISQK
jgi:hypothetical protein